MNLNDLHLFEAVAQHGNFTRAAEAMHTVQSNVTARIKSLEEEFNTTLFSRSSRKVELTAAGKTLLQYSRQINNLLEEARLSVGKDQIVKGQVRIGFLETMMALKGPELVNELAAKFPLVELEFVSGMRDRLINDVVNYRLDAAFVPTPVHLEELEQIHVMNEEIVAVAPLQIKRLDDLLKQQEVKVIVFELGCFFRERLEAWLVSKGVVNYHKMVMNSIEGLIHFIESGIGFSFLPGEIVANFYRDRKVTIFPLPKELAAMKTNLIYRKDNQSSPVLKAFMSLFRE